jgi:hypothetical protein
VKTNSQIKLIKMKKLKFFIMTAFLVVSFIPSQLKAATVMNAAAIVTNNANTTESTKSAVSTDVNAANVKDAAEVAESNANIARLEEIRAMDMSELTPAEKKELREEVHMIQNEQEVIVRDHNRYDNDGPRHHHHGGVVFIGGGGLLLIILILLLL